MIVTEKQSQCRLWCMQTECSKTSIRPIVSSGQGYHAYYGSWLLVNTGSKVILRGFYLREQWSIKGRGPKVFSWVDLRGSKFESYYTIANKGYNISVQLSSYFKTRKNII
jgi:hypothetical protein